MEGAVARVVIDPYELMHLSQHAFMLKSSAKVRGRDDILLKIEHYIISSEWDVPLLLLGGAGCGKSSIISGSVNSTLDRIAKNGLSGGGENGWQIFYHFVGAVPGSTDLFFMLKRLLKQLEVVNESTLPRDLDAACQLCCSVLSNANTKPTIIFIDAVNQFDDDNQAIIMSWLPRKLGPHVRCVFSMIMDSCQHKKLIERETKPQELHLTPLDLKFRKQIVEEMLGEYNKQLTVDQLECLLSKQSSENPLWLFAATEEIRLMKNQETIDECISNLADGLLNLLEKVLARLEDSANGDLIVAAVCFLECSSAGLTQEELLSLLNSESSLMPPSPYDEKDEKERSEKDSSRNVIKRLSKDNWSVTFASLQPFLRPYGDSMEGRLDFYHRALSKAVRRRYFGPSDNISEDDDCRNMYTWWHTKLADYFKHCANIDRKVEEYPYHLSKIEDKTRLGECLIDWSVFDKLYNDEFSAQLFAFWRKAGSNQDMIDQYKAALSELERDENCNDELVALRYSHVARILLQAGLHAEALDIAKAAVKMEEHELGSRPERMVELYSLLSEIYDEKLKLNDFVSPTQLPDLRKTINYGRKSIALRKTFSGDYHKFKLGMSLMKLAFSMESWEACGGDNELSGIDALDEGNSSVDKAKEIFKELNDTGHYAEALMTKGVLAKRGSVEQMKFYQESMDLCLQVYGQISMLTSRLYINIGIVYEDTKNFVKAFEYFRKWAMTSEEVLGPHHPKTLRAKGVLSEPRYKRIADRLTQQHNQITEEGDLELINDINREVEEHESDFLYSSDDDDNDDNNVSNNALNFEEFSGSVDELIENIISMHMHRLGQENANEQEISEDIAEFEDQGLHPLPNENQDLATLNGFDDEDPDDSADNSDTP